MKVYHGSYIEIEKIELAKCLPQKDFGQGFYVTTATDNFFSSNTFSKLADISNQLYLKPWQEIYQMLKKELFNNQVFNI
jgi:hypothetical protein